MTMKPEYVRGHLARDVADTLLKHVMELPWLRVREARREFFMGAGAVTYTYGKGEAAKSYVSEPYSPEVSTVQYLLNKQYDHRYNVCFLNRYDGQQNQLGWHADDTAGTDFDHPIAVISLGAEREIWWKLKEEKGVVPADQRQLLEHGSLFVMPAGFQRDHYHRIPKSDRQVGVRVSLTFRRFNNPESK